MKRKWLSAFALLAVLGGALWFGYAAGGLEEVMEDVTRETVAYPSEEVKALYVNCTSSEVTVEQTDAERVTVEYYTSEHDSIAVSLEDGTLKLEQKGRRNLFGLSLLHPRWVRVEVPAHIGDFEVITTSGRITVSGVSSEGDARVGSTSGKVEVGGAFGSLELGTTSGKIDASGLRVDGMLTAESTSGAIALKDVLAGGDMVLSTTSGKIETERTDAVGYAVNSTSGAVKMKKPVAGEGEGRLTVATSSGAISVSLPACAEVSLSSISGKVSAQLPGEMTDWRISSGTVSGKNSLPAQTHDGDKVLSIFTTSGAIDARFEGK